jgi:hypothetical protein
VPPPASSKTHLLAVSEKRIFLASELNATKAVSRNSNSGLMTSRIYLNICKSLYFPSAGLSFEKWNLISDKKRPLTGSFFPQLYHGSFVWTALMPDRVLLLSVHLKSAMQDLNELTEYK